MEARLGITLPNGYKEINLLRLMAESTQKFELGEQWLRGKEGNAPIVANDARPVQSDRAGETKQEAVSEAPKPPPGSMRESDTVDPDLAHEALLIILDSLEATVSDRTHNQGETGR